MNKVFQDVHADMRALISRSCNDSPPSNDHIYYAFQTELLKHYFKAADVSIDHKDHTISLWTAQSPGSLGDYLYGLTNAVAITISYTNLEETLKGCLESGLEDIRLYKSLLMKYNRISVSAQEDAKSA